jgi:hypothetical protein
MSKQGQKTLDIQITGLSVLFLFFFFLFRNKSNKDKSYIFSSTFRRKKVERPAPVGIALICISFDLWEITQIKCWIELSSLVNKNGVNTFYKCNELQVNSFDSY